MAELIRTQGYRAQVSGVPGAVTPGVSFGQRRPDVEFEARANYQQTLARSLDRISQVAFGIAEETGQRAGAQFALENQLTREQLDAMAKGDMSTVSLGDPMNVYSSAVRKVRALELSGHMEAEARQEMLSLFDKASKGELTTEDAEGKIRGLLDAGGSTLAQVDPDAAFKYRATIATIGGKVIDEIGKTELKRRAIINEQKLSTDYRNILTGIGAYMGSSLPINPETGQEWDLMEVVGKIKENFLANAFAMGGLPVMESYAERIDKDISDLKKNTITMGVINKDPDIGGDAFAALNKLMSGQAGKFQNVFDSMTDVERASMRVEIKKAFTEMVELSNVDKALAKQKDEDESRQLIASYFSTPNPKTLDKLMQIAIRSGAVSPEYVAGLPQKVSDQRPKNPIAEMKLKDDIKAGFIVSLDDFLSRGRELGISDKRLGELFDYLDKSEARANTNLEKDARNAARLAPNTQSTYRQAEEYFSHIETVNQTFAAQRSAWEEGGRKGPIPTKDDISSKLLTQKRLSPINNIITSLENDLATKYGPQGNFKKTNIDFKSMALKYDQSNGKAIGLSDDARAILSRNGFSQAQMDDVEQSLIARDFQQQQLSSIRPQQ